MDAPDDSELVAQVKAHGDYFEAPQGLRERIAGALAAAEDLRTEDRQSQRPARRWWSGAGVAAGLAFAAGVVLSVGVALLYGRPAPPDGLVDQVVASHIRSLMVAHLSDIDSTDQHTVKPWLSGRLNFSPPVTDLAADGFPLIGGRLDYVDNRPVAALVYRHRLHTINVFVWPRRDQASPEAISTTRNGFNVESWQADGMQFWAVSDVQSTDLQRFAQGLSRQSQAR